MRRRSPHHEALGQAIREQRERVAVSQEELAARARLHRTYLGGLERGERNPSLTTLLKIADAAGVELSELLARAEALLTT